MSTLFQNPAIHAFSLWNGSGKIFGQVLIRSLETGFDLRHASDRDAVELRTVAIPDLRALAQATSTGDFRPLRSAPTLQTGWRAHARNHDELERALNGLYPGAVADWFALRNGTARVTNYREFTNRQTGMYRITQMLSDAQASQTIRSCCQPGSCLKRRCWTVESLPPDPPEEKSEIPCLEPCAILLESARKAWRAGQAAETQEK